MANWPSKIRSIRLRAGLTLREAGELVGRDKNTVWRWEAGRVRPGELVREAVVERLRVALVAGEGNSE